MARRNSHPTLVSRPKATHLFVTRKVITTKFHSFFSNSTHFSGKRQLLQVQLDKILPFQQYTKKNMVLTMISSTSAEEQLPFLHVLSYKLFVLAEKDNRSLGMILLTAYGNFLCNIWLFLEPRLALWNSLSSLVELTDSISLRHPAHALYHVRSPYVPMLTAVAVYHMVRDGIAWTIVGLVLALFVGNFGINVYYKIAHGAFTVLGLPLPAPPIHCDILPTANHHLAPPTNFGTSNNNEPALRGSGGMLSRRHQSIRDSANAFPGNLTQTSSESDSLYEYESDYDDDSTVATTRTRGDNLQELFCGLLKELCQKVEVCHEYETMLVEQ